jgi:hypothetical protein
MFGQTIPMIPIPTDPYEEARKAAEAAKKAAEAERLAREARRKAEQREGAAIAIPILIGLFAFAFSGK